MNLLYLCRGSGEIIEIQTYLETAEREVRRISVIANQTRQFHELSSTPETVRCEEVVNSSLAMYQGRLMNACISVEQRHRANRLPFAVEGEIRQVLNRGVEQIQTKTYLEALGLGPHRLQRQMDHTGGYTFRASTQSTTRQLLV